MSTLNISDIGDYDILDRINVDELMSFSLPKIRRVSRFTEKLLDFTKVESKKDKADKALKAEIKRIEQIIKPTIDAVKSSKEFQQAQYQDVKPVPKLPEAPKFVPEMPTFRPMLEDEDNFDITGKGIGYIETERDTGPFRFGR